MNPRLGVVQLAQMLLGLSLVTSLVTSSSGTPRSALLCTLLIHILVPTTVLSAQMAHFWSRQQVTNMDTIGSIPLRRGIRQLGHDGSSSLSKVYRSFPVV